MQYTSALLLIAGLGGSLVHGQGYSSECTDFSLKHNWLIGTCPDKEGGSITSSVFLPHKITNHEATLEWKADGEYARTCSECTLIENGSTLQCYCKGSSRLGSKTTTLNLEEHISNYNGHLLSNLTAPITTTPSNSPHPIPSNFNVQLKLSTLDNACASFGATIGLNDPQDCYYLNLGVQYPGFACGSSVTNEGWEIVGYADKSCAGEAVVRFTPENDEKCLEFGEKVLGFGVRPLWNAD